MIVNADTPVSLSDYRKHCSTAREGNLCATEIQLDILPDGYRWTAIVTSLALILVSILLARNHEDIDIYINEVNSVCRIGAETMRHSLPKYNLFNI